ncbi:hypothetical protein [Mesorhizobium sp. M1E.F.Ca.ET.041.01.1.1]|uniref:hypothetical protein n=1 Tax=Mesorhizobium sp. M1E.F.Ca.ET.041.01.1.1 TaxID=2496759 RepID=UPI000FCA3BD3|nr:hypothetical protein [Mesorhizobium sp. M1E.F.Ca.ET.041.01.1.1]RUW28352.1 hypothetical protein EOA38_25535 [Mesorhizobium sp. M1E.F.Ca.ET.041.01.1.1]
MHVTLKTLSRFDHATVAHLQLEPEQEQFVAPLDLSFSELRSSSYPELEHPFSIVVGHQVVGFLSSVKGRPCRSGRRQM